MNRSIGRYTNGWGDFRVQPITMHRSLRMLFLIFIVASCLPAVVGMDPYRTLGVSRNASQKDIQKRYRELCLRYHPDKNSSGEEKFKQVQAAYEKIKTPESRREHDFFDATTRSSSSYSRSNRQSSGLYENDPVAEAFVRAFGRGSGGNSFFTSSPAFTAASSFFPNSARDIPSPPMPAEVSFKSIYIQKVKIPLEELYRGVSTLSFEVKDNLWTRYRAAWRGKVLLLSLYQGLMYSSPFWRASKLAAAIVTLFVAHLTLPHPDPGREFSATLKPGSKGGKTTVRFASTSYKEPEIIFEIEEGRHPIYTRVGNDLHTSVTISSEEAEDGCIRRILAIDPTEAPIKLVIPPGKFAYATDQQQRRHKTQTESSIKSNTGQQQRKNIIRVQGRGWPIRNAPDVYLYGDVVVTVVVKKPSRKRRKNLSD